MDWTGGRLQRLSRNAAKGVVCRQRRHFARIRTELQTGSAGPGTPFRPNYIGHHPRIHEKHASTPDSDNGKLACRQSAPRRSRVMAGNTSRKVVAGTIAYGVSRTTVRQTTERGPDSPPHAATPGGLLDAGRQRLLNRQDWVGLAPTRPVHMRFSSQTDKDCIGKRRKICGRLVARSPSGKQTGRQFSSLADTEPAQGLFRSVDDTLRICIGTDALTSQALTQRRGTPVGSYAGSSDLMLFDDQPSTAVPEAPCSSRSPLARAGPALQPPPADAHVVPQKARLAIAAWKADASMQPCRPAAPSHRLSPHHERGRPSDAPGPNGRHNDRRLRSQQSRDFSAHGVQSGLQGAHFSPTSDGQPAPAASHAHGAPAGGADADAPWKALLAIPDRSSASVSTTSRRSPAAGDGAHHVSAATRARHAPCRDALQLALCRAGVGADLVRARAAQHGSSVGRSPR